MAQFSINRGLTCEAIMWAGEGPQLVPHDEQHAFRYEVRNQRGNVIGFINADRARQHPCVEWERSVLRDGKIEELVGKYATVQEALGKFLKRKDGVAHSLERERKTGREMMGHAPRHRLPLVIHE